eukprot:gene868-1086_t
MFQKLLTLSLILLNITCLVKGTVEHSGYFNVNPSTNANMFYWFFESQNNATTDPVVLYLTGGPGASMLLSVFYENGPYKVKADLTTEPNPYSWNKVANVIYVDSPVGTGFSYVNAGGYVQSEFEATLHLYSFLTQFFQTYPQFKLNPFYIFGESFAGRQVPNLAMYIDLHNDYIPGPVRINLKGVGLGDAIMDPVETQFPSMIEYAFARGLISHKTVKELEDLADDCKDAFDDSNMADTATFCNTLMGTLVGAAGGPFVNTYNIDVPCPVGLAPLCYDFSKGFFYFSQPSVHAQLGVRNESTLQMQNPLVMQAIMPTFFNSEIGEIPNLLAKYRVLVYGGNNDFIVNVVGVEKWVRKMRWTHRANFNKSPHQPYFANPNEIGGYYQTYKGLSLVKINNAGHFVTHDAPEVGLSVFNNFINNNPIFS